MYFIILVVKLLIFYFVSQGAIDMMIDIYKKEFVRMGGYMTDACEVKARILAHICLFFFFLILIFDGYNVMHFILLDSQVNLHRVEHFLRALAEHEDIILSRGERVFILV